MFSYFACIEIRLLIGIVDSLFQTIVSTVSVVEKTLVKDRSMRILFRSD